MTSVMPPTVGDLFDAMVALRKGKITPDAFRAVMRRSRQLNGAAEHDHRKGIATAALARLSR